MRETFVARKRTRSSVGVVGARRQAAHARGGDFRPSDGQIQNEEQEEERRRRDRGDETRRVRRGRKTAAEGQSLSQAG